MLRTGLSPEQLGPQIGVSGYTLRRVMDGAPCQFRTKAAIAQALGEDPEVLWPPIKLQRRRVAA